LSLQVLDRRKLDREGTRLLGPSLGHETHMLDDAPPLPGYMGRENLPLEALGHHDITMSQLISPQQWP
jgi:hypothetical protein